MSLAYLGMAQGVLCLRAPAVDVPGQRLSLAACRDDEGPRARRSPPDAANVSFAHRHSFPEGALMRRLVFGLVLAAVGLVPVAAARGEVPARTEILPIDSVDPPSTASAAVA